MEHLMSRQAAPPGVNPLLLPAAPPPPGVIPNLDNPEWKGMTNIIVTSIFLAIALITFALRMFTRIYVVRGFGKDDVVLIIATLFSTAEACLVIYHTQHGLGSHIWEVRLGVLTPTFLKLNYISSLLYGVSICTLKLSICLLYLRLSPVKPFRYAVYVTMFAICGFGLGGIISLIAFCIPVEKSWDLFFPKDVGHCIAGPKLSVGNAYFNVFTDIILLLIPLPTVWALQLPFRQKLAVTAVFSTALFCVATSIVRLVELQPLLKSPDITWNVDNAAMWSNLELLVGVTCTSIATMQPFLRRYLPDLLGVTRKSTYGPNGYNRSSRDYSRFGTRGGQPSQNNHSSSDKTEIDDLELGDGPRVMTRVSAPGKGSLSRSVSGHCDSTTSDGTDLLVPRPTHNGIVKTTDFEIGASDAQYMGQSAHKM